MHPPTCHVIFVVSEEFLSSLNLIVGLDQLLDFLSSRLKEISQARATYVVLLQTITNRYVGVKASGDNGEALKLFTFSPSDKLISWLSVNRTPLDLQRQQDVVSYFSPREQELLHQLDIALVIPCILVSRPMGVLCLGRKQDGSSFSNDEIGLLTRLTSQAALAIEHASRFALLARDLISFPRKSWTIYFRSLTTPRFGPSSSWPYAQP